MITNKQSITEKKYNLRKVFTNNHIFTHLFTVHIQIHTHTDQRVSSVQYLKDQLVSCGPQ